mmetsp:Transcript_65921/g.176688  ORF Transcript_65921/g.176688 Transcript_65921/m.176688 type:complete len:144 (+) Transcript_65921:239-670(+)
MISEGIRCVNKEARFLTYDMIPLIIEIQDVKLLHNAAKLSSSPFRAGASPPQTVESFVRWMKKELRNLLGPDVNPIKYSRSIIVFRLKSVQAHAISAFGFFSWFSDMKAAGWLGRVARGWKLMMEEDGRIFLVHCQHFLDPNL